jgi:Domain of unknown function (DUF4296)
MKSRFFIIAFFLFSCSSKKGLPPHILKPAAMQKIYWDVLRADALVFDFVKKDSTKKPEEELAKIQQQIFARHHISKELFYENYQYYKTHPEIMQPMLDSMISKYTRDKYMNTKSSPQIDTIKK